MTQIDKVNVVCGVMVVDSKVLLGLRLLDSQMPNLWEFPGGKVDPGETNEIALAREFKEELDIEIIVSENIINWVFEAPRVNLHFSAYFVRQVAGQLAALEHQALKWVSVRDLQPEEMPPADLPLVEHLKKDL